MQKTYRVIYSRGLQDGPAYENVGASYKLHDDRRAAEAEADKFNTDNPGGYYAVGASVEEVSLTNEQFKKEVIEKTLKPYYRDGNHWFTPEEIWDGANAPLEAFNLSTQQWVEIYSATQ